MLWLHDGEGVVSTGVIVCGGKHVRTYVHMYVHVDIHAYMIQVKEEGKGKRGKWTRASNLHIYVHVYS